MLHRLYYYDASSYNLGNKRLQVEKGSFVYVGIVAANKINASHVLARK